MQQVIANQEPKEEGNEAENEEENQGNENEEINSPNIDLMNFIEGLEGMNLDENFIKQL